MINSFFTFLHIFYINELNYQTCNERVCFWGSSYIHHIDLHRLSSRKWQCNFNTIVIMRGIYVHNYYEVSGCILKLGSYISLWGRGHLSITGDDQFFLTPLSTCEKMLASLWWHDKKFGPLCLHKIFTLKGSKGGIFGVHKWGGSTFWVPKEGAEKFMIAHRK